jgi:phenylacetate-CoA ligase
LQEVAVDDGFDSIRSSVAGEQWPALPGPQGALALALQFQLERTQWLPPVEIEALQARQLALLLRHAHDTVPFYRERLAAAGYQPGMAVTREWFASLPRLARTEVQARGEALHSRAVPPDHQPVVAGQTSGSTGRPIVCLSTAVTRLLWQAFTLRDHLWHRRDLRLKFAAIRPDRGRRGESGLSLPGWGPALEAAFRTGPSCLLHSSAPLDSQIAWLLANDPDYLLTLATNLLEIARALRRRGARLARLREAMTFGETLRAEVRAECEALLGVKVVDLYSAQEAGYLALECPDHEGYHVQAESAIVEILREDGTPCVPREIGRVVVTPLHNFALPLVRYEIGDYAEAGAPCPCGRGLPVIRRILGRERNLALAPDGRKFFPSFPAEAWSGAAPVRQIQLVQKSLRAIEVRYVADRALDAGEEGRLARALRECLAHPYELRCVRLEQIPRTAGGKYEDFICELGA